jgi:signal peptidase II
MDHAIDEPTDSSPHEASETLVERAAPLLLLAASVFALDQVTKAVIRRSLAEGEYWSIGTDLIRISHYENSGAAFGILQGAGPLFVASTLVAIVVISFTIFRSNEYPRWFTLALALVLGGATGNLADRLARGSVTDFIDPTHYPAFNIADSAIVIGVSTLLILTFFERDEPDSAVSTTEDHVEPAPEDSRA